jgi:putative hydrolase of the HAD superfamily
VLDKDRATYRQVLGEWGDDPTAFVFVGNSVRSDVLPVIELGGTGVHVPYHVTWEHEVVHDHGGESVELASIIELPDWLTAPA